MKFSCQPHVFRLFIRSTQDGSKAGQKGVKESFKDKRLHWNAAILVLLSARYSKGWIQAGAKIGRGKASPLRKSSFRPNVHSNILMYCRRHMHLFESCHTGCIFYASGSNDLGHIFFVSCLFVCLLSTLTFAITFEP